MSYTLGSTDLSPAKALQTEMKRRGYYSGAIDGALGAGSIKAAGKWVDDALNMLLMFPATSAQADIAKFVADKHGAVSKAVSAKNLAALDSILQATFRLYKATAHDLGLVVKADTVAFLNRPLNVPSDRAQVVAETVPPEAAPPPGGTAEVPGIGTVPKVAIAGVAVLAAWLLLRK